jgi:hypothetical protein
MLPTAYIPSKPAALNACVQIAIPADAIAKAKNKVVNPKIVLDAPVTFPVCALTIEFATIGIRLTPTIITIKPPIKFPSILVGLLPSVEKYDCYVLYILGARIFIIHIAYYSMPEEENMTSEFNEAVFQIQRLHSIWMECKRLREGGRLIEWKWKLDSAEIELDADAERLDKNIADEEKWIKKIEKTDSDIAKAEKDKNLKDVYKYLKNKEKILRSLQQASGKGSKYRPGGDDDFDM